MKLLNVKLIIKHRTCHHISLPATGYLGIIKICGAVCKYGGIKSQACSSTFLLYKCTYSFLGKKKASISQCQIILRKEILKEFFNFQTPTFPLSTFPQPSARTHLKFKFSNQGLSEILSPEEKVCLAHGRGALDGAITGECPSHPSPFPVWNNLEGKQDLGADTGGPASGPLLTFAT